MTSNFEQYGPPKQERNYADLLDQYAQTRRFDDRTEEIYFDIYRNQSLPRHIRIAARNRIAANHIPFVIKVASSYWSKNSERGDIVDVGIATASGSSPTPYGGSGRPSPSTSPTTNSSTSR